MTFSAKHGWIGLVLASGMLVVSLLPVVASQPKKTSTGPTFASAVAKPLDTYCVSCHSGSEPAAGINLAKLKTAGSISANREVWSKVALNVSNSHMPPAGMPKPTPAQRATLAKYIQDTLSAECKLADPGRVTIRRLNRAEYDNTVRDLLKVDFRPADDFPSDDVGYGFDNIGDVLSISPLLMEKYLTAAEKVSEAAIVMPSRKLASISGNEFSGAGSDGDGAKILFSAGVAKFTHAFAKPGLYALRVFAAAQQAGPEVAKIEVTLDGAPVTRFDVPNAVGIPGSYTHEIKVADPGNHQIGVQFVNDYYDPKVGDRNVMLQRVEIDGPRGGSIDLPASHLAVIPRTPASAADTRAMLASFATRAYRRPARPEEVDRLVKLTAIAREAGEPFEVGMRLAVQAVLTSPNFLFRVELDAPTKTGKTLIDDYELASRLSYFLWSSMPDDTLFKLAATKQLRQPTVLVAQVDRMLKDPRAKALGENFATQWLQLRKLEIFRPNPEQFPTYSNTLRDDMTRETKTFFNALVANDRPITEFLTANYSYMNERLATLYGLPNVKGPEFRKVLYPDARRAGVLTQASVLTLTSNPTRTSPTKRGKWVLENILGTPPPPPPPGVGDLKEEREHKTARSLREMMVDHRKNAICASCHSRMDPIGFGMENFDAIGRWRTKDGALPIDSSGTLPDGKTFRGPTQLREILVGSKGQFVSTLSERLLTYATGRGVGIDDQCAVDEIVKRVETNGYRFSEVAKGVALSEPFRMRGRASKPVKKP